VPAAAADADADAEAAPRLVLRGREIALSTPLLMGIVNATPDSFSDAGDHPDTSARVARALELLDQGAGIIDVGGQSGITGVPEVAAGNEIARVVPVVEGIVAAAPDALVSVDTYKPAVVSAVLDAGAAVVNDVSGLLYPEVAELCAAAGAGLVVMHNRSRPKQRLTDPLLYDDVTGDVVDMLSTRMAEVQAAGVPHEAIVLDPGPDFSKTPHQTVTVLREIDRVRALGRPLLLALSRKDFIGAITSRPPKQRLAGTLAAIGHLAGRPGYVLRVHDVDAVADYLAVAAVLAGRADLAPDAELAPELRREPSSRTTGG
jgi:dihydropteroate synthase